MLGRLLVAFIAGAIYSSNKKSIDSIAVNAFTYFDDIISSKIGA